MISFIEGDYSEGRAVMSMAKIKKLVSEVMENNPFAEGTLHGGLHADHIKEIVNHLMFVEGNSSIQIIIDKEVDGYHLSLTVDKKEK